MNYDTLEKHYLPLLKALCNSYLVRCLFSSKYINSLVYPTVVKF